MDDKRLEEQMDRIAESLDRIADSLEKLSECVDAQEKAVCVKGIIFVSQDY